jgi:hypothetical protein
MSIEANDINETNEQRLHALILAEEENDHEGIGSRN